MRIGRSDLQESGQDATRWHDHSALERSSVRQVGVAGQLASIIQGAYVVPFTRVMSEAQGHSAAEDPLSSSGSEPLVPILRSDERQIDAVALATWHEALSNTVAVEVPHDLMGLWL